MRAVVTHQPSPEHHGWRRRQDQARSPRSMSRRWSRLVYAQPTQSQRPADRWSTSGFTHAASKDRNSNGTSEAFQHGGGAQGYHTTSTWRWRQPYYSAGSPQHTPSTTMLTPRTHRASYHTSNTQHSPCGGYQQWHWHEALERR